jgi:hypothetical protein
MTEGEVRDRTQGSVIMRPKEIWAYLHPLELKYASSNSIHEFVTPNGTSESFFLIPVTTTKIVNSKLLKYFHFTLN